MTRRSTMRGDAPATEKRHDAVWSTLRRAWAMEIVLVLAAEPVHFNGIKRRLDVPASTLSTRLSDLEGAGLVQRSAAGGPPAPVRYELTDRGAALAEPLEAIDALADGERPTPR